MTGIWTALAALALLWPGRALGLFDGLPLDGRAEGVVIGVAVPALWWLHRRFLLSRVAKAAIALLLLVKLAGLALAPQGLCARFSTDAPLRGSIQTIPVDEPRGILRSWDLRADWRAAAPACTAVFTRSFERRDEFPAWFINIVDFIGGQPRPVRLEVHGYVAAPSAGTLAIRTGEDMTVRGWIGGRSVSAERGGTIAVPVIEGEHELAIDAQLTGSRWRLAPLWNGADAWDRVLFTTTAPARGQRYVAPAVGAATTLIVLALVMAWAYSAVRALRVPLPVLAWSAGASAAMVLLAAAGGAARIAGVLLLAAAAVPMAPRLRNVRGAFLLLGIPWLAFFAALAMPMVGHVTAYSADDWLTYQVAGYRIFMGGYWLEGGSRAFDYQPLYRWVSGTLHVVFGDASAGEMYWDSACLLAGALLAFHLGARIAGFRAGLFAAAGTLATFTLGTVWYFTGRGLSEITAAGFGFWSAFLLLRARLGRLRTGAMAGVLSTLMFYTRLNHLVFVPVLAVLLLPSTTRCTWASLREGLRTVRVGVAAVYLSVFALGVCAFMLRTWWYTDAFSLLYGTSLHNNDTGLRLTTLASAAVWSKVGHSLASLVWMNEPPRVDARAAFVVAGVLAALLAVGRVPPLRALPLAIVLATFGAMAGALFAHTHNYPGRMSVHLVPFASALAVGGVAAVWRSAS